MWQQQPQRLDPDPWSVRPPAASSTTAAAAAAAATSVSLSSSCVAPADAAAAPLLSPRFHSAAATPTAVAPAPAAAASSSSKSRREVVSSSLIDACLVQDERFLSCDAAVSEVPIGSYTPFARSFKVVKSASGSGECAATPLPPGLKFTEGSPVGLLAALEAMWMANGNDLFLLDWASATSVPLKLSFSAPVLAVGSTDLKPALRLPPEAEKKAAAGAYSHQQLLLVATANELSLWLVSRPNGGGQLLPRGNGSRELEALALPYIIKDVRCTVTCITGHAPSGRLFLGDSKGNVSEFVFVSASTPQQQSWKSFLFGESPTRRNSGGGQQPQQTHMVVAKTELVRINSSAGLFSRMTAPTSKRDIVDLSVDEHRNLLWSVNAQSNIQLFYIPPPELNGNRAEEKPVVLVASLSRQEIVQHLLSIYRQVLRAPRPVDGGLFPQRNTTGERLLAKTKVLRVFPLNLEEGEKVIAVAVTSSGTRLFLRARVECPLVVPKLCNTNFPAARAYQHVRSVDIVNWKPPPNVVAQVRGELRPNDNPPDIAACFIANRTFIAIFQVDQPGVSGGQPNGGLVLACVMPDEGAVLRKQARITEADAAKELREWLTVTTPICGCSPDDASLGDLRIFDLAEIPCPSGFNSLLEYRGMLPHPHNVVGRAAAAKVARIRSSSVADNPVGRSATAKNSKTPAPSLLGSSSRLSPSPWDVAPRETPVPYREILGPPTTSASSSSSRPAYVPPAALHSLAATQVTPARVFVLLTSHGVLFVQQCRVIDMLAEAADQRLHKAYSAATTSAETSNRLLLQQLLQPADSSRLDLMRNCLDNVHLLAQVLSAEFVMSVMWHGMVYNCRRLRWPAVSKVRGRRLPTSTTTGTTTGLPDAANNDGPFAPFAPRSMFATPTAQWKTEDRSTTTPVATMTPFALDALGDDLVAGSKGEREFLADLLVATVTDDSLNSQPAFGEGSTAVVSPSDGNITARVKGAALFLSRILRPFWRVPILEACALEAPTGRTLQELLLGGVSVVYRRAAIPADDNVSCSGGSRGKRRRNASPSASKRQRTAHGLEEKKSPLADRRSVLVLMCRFSAAELNKVNGWLMDFTEVLQRSGELINATNSQTRLMQECEHFTRLARTAEAASQALTLVAALTEPLEKQGSRELPEQVFDLLTEATLWDLLCSERHCAAVRHISLLHVLPSAFLAEHCPLHFNEEDLRFQASLEPLQWVHEMVYGPRWRSVKFAECQPLPRDVAGLPEVQSATEQLLALAGSTVVVTGHRLRAIVALLAELQLFAPLAELLALLAEKSIALASCSPGKNGGGSGCAADQQDPGNYYLQNPLFRKCLHEYFTHVEDLLWHYKRVDETDPSSGGRAAAKLLVDACLQLPGPTVFAGGGDNYALAVSWLQCVILDWVTEVGQQTFPVSLADCRTPAFVPWVQTQQGALRDKTLDMLCEMFAKNDEFDKLSTFLTTVAFQTWTDPVTVLADQAVMKNGDQDVVSRVVVPANLCRQQLSSSCQLNLTAYVAQLAANFAFNSSPEDVKRIQPLWDAVIEFVNATKGGLALHERHALLIQGVEAIQTALQKQKKKKQPNEHLISAFARITRGRAMCELQAALLRETAELCIWVMVTTSSEAARKAFSPDFETRIRAFESIRLTDRKTYVHLQNVQSLIYLLQWKLYESPTQLFELIVDFEKASECLLPYPGLALLEAPKLRLEGLPLDLRAAILSAAPPMQQCKSLPRATFIETARVRREDIIEALAA